MSSSARSGVVYWGERVAGYVRETESGMEFRYDVNWLAETDAPPVSLTMPLRTDPYATEGPHPFFAGLLPEGWLHNIALSKLKLAPNDWFGQMLALCRDCVGAVSIQPDE